MKQIKDEGPNEREREREMYVLLGILYPVPHSDWISSENKNWITMKPTE